MIFKKTLDTIQKGKKKKEKSKLQRVGRKINSDDDCDVEWKPNTIRLMM